MAIVTVTGLTAARMEAMEDDQVISGAISGDDLILTKRGGATVNAGNVRGPQGLYGAPQLVSTLPPAPANGDEVYYQNAAMATDGVIWHLRYRSGSPSAYKWEVINATPLFVVNTGQAMTNLAANWTWQDVTNTPLLTIPLAGDYFFDYGCNSVHREISGSATHQIDINLGYTGQTNPIFLSSRVIVRDQYDGGPVRVLTRGSSQPTGREYRLKMQGNQAVGNNQSTYDRYISATPIRVG